MTSRLAWRKLRPLNFISTNFKWLLLNSSVLAMLAYFATQSAAMLAGQQKSLAGVFFDKAGLAALAMLPVYMLLASFSFKLAGSLCLRVRVSLPDAMEQSGLTVVSKYIPGSLWSVAVRAAMCRRYGITAAQSVTFSVFEMAVGVSSGAAVGGALWLAALTGRPAYSIIAFLGMSAFFYWGYRLMAFCAARMRQGNNGLPPSAESKFSRIARLASVAPQAFFKGTLYYSLPWIGMLPVFYCYLGMVLHVTGFGEAGIEQGMEVAAYYIVGILTGFFALFAPGGVVVREGVFVALAGKLIGYQEATALAILMRVWFTAYDVFFGAAATLLFFCRKQSVQFSIQKPAT